MSCGARWFIVCYQMWSVPPPIQPELWSNIDEIELFKVSRYTVVVLRERELGLCGS